MSYSDRHLVQDTAYQSLLKSKRQQLHRQIAQVLEEQFPETTQAQPEWQAHHYTEAGLIERAIPYWQQAGQQAVARSANTEAISHLTKGLELLKTLPDTPKRTRHELTLRMALGPALIATKGNTSPESRTHLHPGVGVMSAGRRNSAALPCAVWPMAVLFSAGGVADDT